MKLSKQHSMYESEHTLFIKQLKASNPQMDEGQRAGRAIWWDKHLDREAIAEWKQSGVPQKPYVYGDDPRQRR